MNECDVLWSGKYRQNWETELHNHTYFQLIGFSEGKGCIIVEDKTYTIHAGQIYLIQPQQMHAVRASSQDPLKIMDIKFSIQSQSLFEQLRKIDITLGQTYFKEFCICFNKIIQESMDHNSYYYKIICNYLYEMLVHFIRNLNEESSQPQLSIPKDLTVKSYKGIDVYALIDYIRFNYSHIISLDDLSQFAHVNKTTLCNMFKELFFTTPIRYINGIRLDKAKELLLNTNMSVGEIADLVGFQSIHYFSRFFKEKEKCTPIEYRMCNKKSHFFYYS